MHLAIAIFSLLLGCFFCWGAFSSAGAEAASDVVSWLSLDSLWQAINFVLGTALFANSFHLMRLHSAGKISYKHVNNHAIDQQIDQQIDNRWSKNWQAARPHRLSDDRDSPYWLQNHSGHSADAGHRQCSPGTRFDGTRFRWSGHGLRHHDANPFLHYNYFARRLVLLAPGQAATATGYPLYRHDLDFIGDTDDLQCRLAWCNALCCESAELIRHGADRPQCCRPDPRSSW